MIVQITRLGEVSIDKGLRHIFDLLVKFQGSETTYKRDFVYSWIRLLHYRPLGHKIYIRYSKSVEELFQDAMEYCFAELQRLDPSNISK
jgi:hypothetical protein